MSGVLNHPSDSLSSPDLFQFVGESDSSSFAVRETSSSLWLFVADHSSTSRIESEASSGWTPIESVFSDICLGVDSPLRCRGFRSSSESAALFAFELDAVRSLSKLIASRGKLPKELALDFAVQAKKQFSISGVNVAERSVGLFGVDSQARLVDFAALLLSARSATKLPAELEIPIQPPISPAVVSESFNIARQAFFEKPLTTLKQFIESSGFEFRDSSRSRMMDHSKPIQNTRSIPPKSSGLASSSRISNVWKDRRIQAGIGIGSVAIVAIGLYALFGSTKSAAVASTSTDGKAREVVNAKAPSTSVEAGTASEIEGADELDLTGSTDRTELVTGVSPLVSATESMTSLTNSVDASSLVASEIKLNDLLIEPNAQVPDGKVTDLASSDSAEADAAFETLQLDGPKLDADMAAALPKQSAPPFEDDPATSEEDASLAADVAAPESIADDSVALVSYSLPLDKPLVQKYVKAPAGFNKNTAAALIKLDIPDGLNMEPETPMLLVGKQTVERTIFRKEESAMLKVYVRSQPKPPWLIQFATRIRLSASVEIPVDVKLIKNSIDQLFALKTFQSNQLSLLNQLRQHPRANKCNIFTLEKAIESKSEELDEMIEVLREAEYLATAFSSSNNVEVQVAASESGLPQQIGNE